MLFEKNAWHAILWKQKLETLAAENLGLLLVGELLSTRLYRHVRCLHEVRIPSPAAMAKNNTLESLEFGRLESHHLDIQRGDSKDIQKDPILKW